MKILQVITDTDRRGAQVFATDLGAAMTTAGHTVETVALAPGQQSPRLDVGILGERQRGLATLRALRRKMAEVDVTIAHGSSTGLACAVAGGGRRRPFVYRQISDPRFWAGSWPRRLRVALYLRRARAIVALSAGAKQDLVDHYRLRPGFITVVPNGVPVGAFHEPDDAERLQARTELGLDATGFVALYIGALVPEKGADVAIDAVRDMTDMTLVIAGGGPERTALESLAARTQADVHFVGVLSDPFPAYAASDVVLLPSRGGDSMPATLIEAGFCGLPTIATPIGSITDVVLDGSTGIVVPPGDAHALAAAMRRLAADPALRDAMSTSARQHCLQNFEISVVAAGWLAVLERQLA